MDATQQRFWAKVRKTDTCWEWTGGTNGVGYGRFSVNGALVYPHRWSYEQAFGEVPEGLVIDHLCRNPGCVRPTHLDVVTPRENNLRGLLGFSMTGRCRAGLHDMTLPENVYQRPTGKRQCWPCRKAARADYWREKSA